MSDRCSGHCCRRFFLPFSPADLAEKAASGRFTPDAADWVLGGGPRFLGEWVPDAVNCVVQASDAPGYAYTCNFLQPNGDCGVYDLRPSVCRDYPMYDTGGRCVYADCTWSLWKAGLPAVPARRTT